MTHPFLDHQSIFICYPHGAGGTHLSNLISLDPSFSPKKFSDHNELYNSLYEVYSNRENTTTHLTIKEGHFIVSKHDQFVEYLENINYSKYNNSVHLGHSICFLKNTEILNKIPNKKYIIISTKDTYTKELLGNRQFSLLGKDCINDLVFPTADVEDFLYSREFFERYHHVRPKDIIDFEGSYMFQRTIGYIINKINNEFNLNIPVDQADTLHRLWKKNIIKHD